MADPQLVTLTPQQYQSFNAGARNLGSRASGTPVGSDNNITGYTIPLDVYSQTYKQMSNFGFIGRGSDLPTPANINSAQAAAAPAGITPQQAPAAPPSYAQFAQNFANRPSPVTYNGGAPPAGMNAADAATLQSIYAPKKSVGGFVSPFAAGEQFAAGGPPSDGMPTGAEMGSWVTRREASDATHNGGLFNSPVPGRTDKLDTLVPAGAYVIPADVVSGLGEGNTMAGSSILDKMFHSNPFGIQGQKMHGGVGIPHAPAAYRQPRAAGGATDGHVPIVAAGGEYLVHPDAVKKLGKGNIKKGHKILDHFVVHSRKQITNTMKKLPGPKK